MPAKAALLKGILMAAADPEMAAKTLLVVLMVILSFLLLVVSPFVLVLSTPLAPPETVQLYVEGTAEAITALGEGWYGPPEIDWRAVVAVDAARRRQDFSGVTLLGVEELALLFVEVVETREKTVFVGYEPVYDEEGNVVGERPVYQTMLIPVYRVLSMAEVGTLLGMTAEEIQWAEAMFNTIREGGHL